MPRRDRILFVAPSAYPYGGIQTWLDYLLPGLEGTGWHPQLAVTSGVWHQAQAYADAHPEWPPVFISNPTGSEEGRVRALLNMLRRTAPDMVVAVNIPDLFVAVARLRARGLQTPHAVMAIHGIVPDLYEDARNFRDILDGVIFTNRLAGRLLVAHGFEDDRVHYAPYGVRIPETSSAASMPDSSPLRIAYVGRLEQWQKRVRDLRGVLDGLVQQGLKVELLVAGSGPAEAELQADLAAHQAAGRVRFLGQLAPAELENQLYRQADVLLLTSLWETGPIVIWEAMAHGLAVVSSRYVGAGLEAGLQHEENCLLFPVGDTDQAAASIGRLADGPLRSRLVQRARELIRGRYSVEASVREWSGQLRRILESPQRPAPARALRIPAAGRLDRLFGVALGETVRRAAGVRFQHVAPGDEWPHSYGRRRDDDRDFWELARRLDEGQVQAEGAGS